MVGQFQRKNAIPKFEDRQLAKSIDAPCSYLERKVTVSNGDEIVSNPKSNIGEAVIVGTRYRNAGDQQAPRQIVDFDAPKGSPDGPFTPVRRSSVGGDDVHELVVVVPSYRTALLGCSKPSQAGSAFLSGSYTFCIAVKFVHGGRGAGLGRVYLRGHNYRNFYNYFSNIVKSCSCIAVRGWYPHIAAEQRVNIGASTVSGTEGKYSVELFKEGGEGAGQEEIIDRHDNLTVARAIYRGRVSQNPGRLVMLCDRARVLARSDRPETMP